MTYGSGNAEITELNVMTEDEAKQHICHKTISAEVTSVVDADHCLGAECMAWRALWQQKDYIVGLEPGAPWEKFGPERGVGGATTRQQTWVRKVGYCGLVPLP